jgi:DNA-binding response OmpR family regulator
LSSAEPYSGERRRRYYSFGDFTLDMDGRVLRHRGEGITLRSKSFEVLSYLVGHYGQLVTKDTLMEVVWPDTAVTENSLAQCMVEIRRALDDDSHQLIRTIAAKAISLRRPSPRRLWSFPLSQPSLQGSLIPCGRRRPYRSGRSRDDLA